MEDHSEEDGVQVMNGTPIQMLDLSLNLMVKLVGP